MTSTSVRLSWSDPNGIEEGYRIYRSTSPFTPETAPPPLATLPPNTTVYTDDTAAPNTTYYYMVSAFLGSVEQFGQQLSVTTGAGTPTLLEYSLEEVDAIGADALRGILLSGDVQTSGQDQLII